MRARRLGLAVLLGSGLALPALAGLASAAAAPGDGGWTVYHGDALGSGAAATTGSVSLSTPRWTSPALDGQIYGEPLVFSGNVYVATENDTVYALSATTGAIVWSTRVGTAVPAGSLPCGNISPTVGITGTPVIDPARAELFVVADTVVHSAPAHELIGLDTATGHTELAQDADPAGATTAALLQRTGAALDAGRVVFGFGGNYGDCGPYHGWVESVPEAGGTPLTFAIDSGPGEREGAVWMGGAAPVVDSGGNVWVSVGNGSMTSADQPYDHSDSVLELSPSLALRQYFAPTSWAADNAADLDLSTAPALLADGQVVVSGKSRVVYLLDGSALGGIGGQRASLPSGCADDVDGGVAVQGTTVYFSCQSGMVAVQATPSPPALHVLWRSGEGGGPPIVAGGLVWTIAPYGIVFGLDPTSGAVRQEARVGRPANHFPTPSVGAGLLLVPTSDRVVAFAVTSAAGTSSSSSATTSTTVPPTTTTARAGSPATPAPGDPSAVTIVAVLLAAGALAVLGITAARRRARGRRGVD